MADRSREGDSGPARNDNFKLNNLGNENRESKSGEDSPSGRMYVRSKDVCENKSVLSVKSDAGVVENCTDLEGRDGDGRKKRCVDRYDSSESSDSDEILEGAGRKRKTSSPIQTTEKKSRLTSSVDDTTSIPSTSKPTNIINMDSMVECSSCKTFVDKSGVVVLSPAESSACSGSDITEPRSPCSPASSSASAPDDNGARMPAWACEPASTSPCSSAAPPSATPDHRKRSNLEALIAERLHSSQLRRIATPKTSHDNKNQGRITEYYNQKMKPHNALKRESPWARIEESKKKCVSKIGAAGDLEKYISYLSQTLNSKVLKDVDKQSLESSEKIPENPSANIYPAMKNVSSSEITLPIKIPSVSALIGMRKNAENNTYQSMNCPSSKAVNELRRDSASSNDSLYTKIPDKDSTSKAAFLKMKDSTISCTSKNLITAGTGRYSPCKSQGPRKNTTGNKRPSRKIAAITASNKNITWSKLESNLAKASGLKTSQNLLNPKLMPNPVSNPVPIMPAANLKVTQPQECKLSDSLPNLSITNDAKTSISFSNTINNIHFSMANVAPTQTPNQMSVQHCNNGQIPSSSSMPSFLAMPQTVMLTTLRLPPNGTPATSMNNMNNINSLQLNNYNRQNLTVGSPTKLNSQFVFPFMQNLGGTVVQIPNVMTKVGPNFVLPHPTQIQTQQQNTCNNIQPQQPTAPMLINGTLLKLASTPSYSVTQSSNPNNLSFPVLNKNINTSLPTMLTSKPNYTVNMNTSVFNVQQSGFFINTVPNVPKEFVSADNSHNRFTTNPHYTHTTISNQQSVFSESLSQLSETFAVSNNIVQYSNFSNMCDSSRMNTIPQPPDKLPLPSLQCVKNETFAEQYQSKDSNITSVNTEIRCQQHEMREECAERLSEHQTNENNSTPTVSKIVSENPRIAEILSRPFAKLGPSTNLYSESLPVLRNSKVDEEVETSSLLEDKTSDFSEDKTSDTSDDKTSYLSEDNSVLGSPIDHSSPSESLSGDREENVFTQITVMKDISSNVENTLIESTFVGTPPSESSESGIGTDKSIDSPTDSRTSKECDDDSTLSLSVSVCSVEVQACQKSPLLKQPEIIRFPPMPYYRHKSTDKKHRVSTPISSTVICLWENCKLEFEREVDLLDHLQMSHVNGQAGKSNFVCLWETCKVRGKPSCSRLWLERHALSHGGNKPFKCIVDGCWKRFSTQILLERHVNNHFNDQSSQLNAAKKTPESGPKLIRRNGKKLRYRRQPWSARMFDFFDPGMMEGLSWRLYRCTRWRLAGGCPLEESATCDLAHGLTLRSKVTATRYNTTTHIREALVTYTPQNVLEDEWVPATEVKKTKRVEIAQLPAHAKVTLYEQFCASYRYVHPATNNELNLKTEIKLEMEPPNISNGVSEKQIMAEKLPRNENIKSEKVAKKSVKETRLQARLKEESDSSRKLNNLILKHKKPEPVEECKGYLLDSRDLFIDHSYTEKKTEVSGAKKRKMGRRYGGNSFWPCGR